jgi:hypothetical protein
MKFRAYQYQKLGGKVEFRGLEATAQHHLNNDFKKIWNGRYGNHILPNQSQLLRLVFNLQFIARVLSPV